MDNRNCSRRQCPQGLNKTEKPWPAGNGGRGSNRGSGLIACWQLWKTAFFAEHGVFSMATAHAMACQSARR